MIVLRTKSHAYFDGEKVPTYIDSIDRSIFCDIRKARPNRAMHAPTLSITDGMPEAGGGGASASTSEAPAASSDDDGGGDGDGEDDCCPPRRKHPSPGPEPHHSGIARPPARRNAGATPAPDPEIALWRLPTVLQHVPISRSGWWAGVKTGKFPQPVRLSSRCVAWRAADIRALVASL